MKTCQDCGCKIIGNHCVNCHEETFIHEQYIDQGIKLPDEKTEFMKRVAQQSGKLSKPEEKRMRL